MSPPEKLVGGPQPHIAASSGLGKFLITVRIVTAVCKWIFRLAAGRPILGAADRRPTNATFLTRGTERYRGHEAARLTSWAYLPEGVRAAVRLWVVLVAFSWVTAAVTGSVMWWVSAWAGLGLSVGWLGWRVARRIRGWRHQRRYFRPLLAALRDMTHMPGLPDTALHLPLNFKHRKAKITLTLPGTEYYGEKFRGAVDLCARQKLGLAGLMLDCDGVGGKTVMTIMHCPEPPRTVRLCDLVAAAEACDRGEVILGVGSDERPFKASFKRGEPHWGFSVNTQRGKSTWAQWIAAQILHNDINARVTYIDPKAVSCEPLRGTPGLRLASNPGDLTEMWDAVHEVRAELDRRRNALLADPTIEFSMHVLILDELNMFADMSRDQWRDYKYTRPDLWHEGDAPIVSDLKAVLRMGGQFSIHVMVFAQRLDVNSCFGIAGLRDLFGLRGLGGYRANNWKMLIGTTPVPRSQRGVGRWIICFGEDEAWIQNPYSSDGTRERWEIEVRDYAQANRKSATSAPPASVEGVVVSSRAERLYTATEASSDQGSGVVTHRLDAIYKARSRAKQKGELWPQQATAAEWCKLMGVTEDA